MTDEMNVCRNCHLIYPNNQKFCGNGCHKEDKFNSDKIEKGEIEPYEIKLAIQSDEDIRWVCLGCKNDFTTDTLKGSQWTCPTCQVENDFYPFSKKSCNICVNDANIHRELPIWAKSCEKCGESDFIINEKVVNSLKSTGGLILKEEDKWVAPPEFMISKKTIEEVKNKNILSVTFTILTTNIEYITFGQNLQITLGELIKKSKGYVPNSIYDEILKNFTLSTVLFSLKYSAEPEQFTLKSAFSMEMVELDPRFAPTGEPVKWDENKELILPESQLIQLKCFIPNHFFTLKINIWAF